MALLGFGGAEGGDPRVDNFTPTGAPTVDGSFVESGDGAYVFDATSEYLQLNFAGGVFGRTYFLRFGLYVASLPSATHNIALWLDGLLTAGIQLELMSTGKLRLGNSASESSVTLASGQWYVVEFSILPTSGVDVVCQVRVGGTLVCSRTLTTNIRAPDRLRFGITNSPSSPVTLRMDNVVVCDDTGAANNTWPGTKVRVTALMPTADNAVGSDWKLGDGTSPGGVAYTAVDNAPPVGVSDVDGTRQLKQIRDAVNNVTGPNADADFTMETYTAAGVASGATVKGVRAVSSIADNASSAVTGAIAGVSNPAIAEATLATPASGQAGTWPSNWSTNAGGIAENPSVTLGTAPVVRVGKRTGTTNALLVSQVALSVLWEPGPQTVEPDTISSAEAVGEPTLTAGSKPIQPDTIPSAEAVGEPTLTLSTPSIQPDTIPSAEAVNQPLLLLVGYRAIKPTTIASEESVGSPTVSDGGASAIQPDTIASGETVAGPRVYLASDPAATTPRNSLTNPETAYTYEWAINHSTEEALRIGRQIERGAPAEVMGFVRQQSHIGALVLHVEGTILDPAQHAEFEAFFDDCDDTELVYRDAAGDEYRAIVTTYESNRERTPRNPLFSELLWFWRYKLDLEVLDGALSGPYVGIR